MRAHQQIDLREIAMGRAMIGFRAQHCLEGVGCGGELTALQGEQSFLDVEIDLDLLVLLISGALRARSGRRRLGEVLLGPVEQTLATIGARELNVKIGARWVEASAFGQRRQRVIQPSGVDVHRAEAAVRSGRFAPDLTICSSSRIASSRRPRSNKASPR